MVAVRKEQCWRHQVVMLYSEVAMGDSLVLHLWRQSTWRPHSLLSRQLQLPHELPRLVYGFQPEYKVGIGGRSVRIAKSHEKVRRFFVKKNSIKPCSETASCLAFSMSWLRHISLVLSVSHHSKGNNVEFDFFNSLPPFTGNDTHLPFLSSMKDLSRLPPFIIASIGYV